MSALHYEQAANGQLEKISNYTCGRCVQGGGVVEIYCLPNTLLTKWC